MNVKRHKMKPVNLKIPYVCIESNNRKYQLVTMDKSVFIEERFPKYGTLDELLVMILCRVLLRGTLSITSS